MGGGELVWEGVIAKVRTEPDGQIMKNSLWNCVNSLCDLRF